MASQVQSNFRHRMNLGRVVPIVDTPNLIDIQKSSYDKFLQAEVAPRERREVGLEAVFRSVFPIKDFDGTSERGPPPEGGGFDFRLKAARDLTGDAGSQSLTLKSSSCSSTS